MEPLTYFALGILAGIPLGIIIAAFIFIAYRAQTLANSDDL